MAPRWIIRLVALAVSEAEHDDVIGDLEELHGCRVQRWGWFSAVVVTVLEASGLILWHVLRRAAGSILGGRRWISAVEVRLALRLARKQPVMTLTAVVALGLGIGIVAGAFSIVQQVVSSELPAPALSYIGRSESEEFNIRPGGGEIERLFPGLVTLMAVAGLLACFLPARRALAIQPVEALQADA